MNRTAAGAQDRGKPTAVRTGKPSELVAVDVGGTHARFAIAKVGIDERITLDAETVFATREHADLPSAWRAFAAASERPLPRVAAIAVACAVGGKQMELTNSHWMIRPDDLCQQLDIDTVTLLNNFGAIGHAIAHLLPGDLRHVCGPDTPLPSKGVIAVVGPGTGLGVALVARHRGSATVLETEGGHAGFSPFDTFEDRLTAELRARYGRVSLERVASGPALASIHAVVAATYRSEALQRTDMELWADALAGTDPLAVEALERFCCILGSVAGDIALLCGASTVILAGGVGSRLAEMLPCSGFAARFAAKGRLAGRVASVPVRVITHPQPGLIGAVAAFVEQRSTKTAARPNSGPRGQM